jgi:hypothetical protein
VEHLKAPTLHGRLLALPTNIRLGWKGLPWTNTLAYYSNSKIRDVKVFIIFDPSLMVGVRPGAYFPTEGEAKRCNTKVASSPGWKGQPGQALFLFPLLINYDCKKF